MKNTTLFLTIMALVLTVNSYAQKIFTVNNTPGAAADYNNLQTAINEVNSGDKLYVQHSKTSYGNITIADKYVEIIGRSGRDINYRPTLGNVLLGNGSDNTKISGIKAREIYSRQTKIKDIIITNNFADTIAFGYGDGLGEGSAENIVIQGNVCNNLYLVRGTNGVARNCIIANNIVFSSVKILSSASSHVFANNILANPEGISIVNSSPSDLVIENCILIANAVADKEVKVDNKANNGVVKFKNCLTYNYGGGKLTINKTDKVQLENTQENVNPLFTKVDASKPTSIAGTALGWDPVEDNVKLQDASTFINECLYEGHNFSNFGLPAEVPSVKMSLESPTVDNGGKLKVTINAQTN